MASKFFGDLTEEEEEEERQRRMRGCRRRIVPPGQTDWLSGGSGLPDRNMPLAPPTACPPDAPCSSQVITSPSGSPRQQSQQQMQPQMQPEMQSQMQSQQQPSYQQPSQIPMQPQHTIYKVPCPGQTSTAHQQTQQQMMPPPQMQQQRRPPPQMQQQRGQTQQQQSYQQQSQPAVNMVPCPNQSAEPRRTGQAAIGAQQLQQQMMPPPQIQQQRRPPPQMQQQRGPPPQMQQQRGQTQQQQSYQQQSQPDGNMVPCPNQSAEPRRTGKRQFGTGQAATAVQQMMQPPQIPPQRRQSQLQQSYQQQSQQAVNMVPCPNQSAEPRQTGKRQQFGTAALVSTDTRPAAGARPRSRGRTETVADLISGGYAKVDPKSPPRGSTTITTGSPGSDDQTTIIIQPGVSSTVQISPGSSPSRQTSASSGSHRPLSAPITGSPRQGARTIPCPARTSPNASARAMPPPASQPVRLDPQNPPRGSRRYEMMGGNPMLPGSSHFDEDAVAAVEPLPESDYAWCSRDTAPPTRKEKTKPNASRQLNFSYTVTEEPVDASKEKSEQNKRKKHEITIQFTPSEGDNISIQPSVPETLNSTRTTVGRRRNDTYIIDDDDPSMANDQLVRPHIQEPSAQPPPSKPPTQTNIIICPNVNPAPAPEGAAGGTELILPDLATCPRVEALFRDMVRDRTICELPEGEGQFEPFTASTPRSSRIRNMAPEEALCQSDYDEPDFSFHHPIFQQLESYQQFSGESDSTGFSCSDK